MLLADKPAGVTSHDVVAAARRAYGERRIGHGGTLDPFATGLLVLLLGRATRLNPYLEGEPKAYEATIRFGSETTTDDPTGEVMRTAPPPAFDAIGPAIEALTGTIEQEPPAYSAKKREGRRAYDAARAGKALALAPARVVVHRWEVRAWREPELDVVITCGGGTYIRALARDLGRLTGSAAHLAALRRVASGPFTVADALSFDELKRAARPARPALDAVPSLPVERLTSDGVTRVRRGQRVAASRPGVRAALTDEAGALVAIAQRDGSEWQPRMVLSDA
jgi:tRNA pseudouridine55 synthase